MVFQLNTKIWIFTLIPSMNNRRMFYLTTNKSIVSLYVILFRNFHCQKIKFSKRVQIISKSFFFLLRFCHWHDVFDICLLTMLKRLALSNSPKKIRICSHGSMMSKRLSWNWLISSHIVRHCLGLDKSKFQNLLSVTTKKLKQNEYFTDVKCDKNFFFYAVWKQLPNDFGLEIINNTVGLFYFKYIKSSYLRIYIKSVIERVILYDNSNLSPLLWF